MEQLSSHGNPLVKQVRLLRQKKGRDETGLFLVEGIHHVGAAVEADWEIETLVYAPGLLTSDFALRLVDGQSRHGVRCAALTPDLFAAIGVHSGLAPGAAGSLPEALAAMRGEAAAHPARPLPVPTIVFHGDHDRTVHPRNGEQALAAALAGHDGTAQVEQGSSGGRRYTKTVHHTTDGGPIAEHWVLHGAGHAWSGGSKSGSYADEAGPDASREMLRFFLDQATTSSARSASIPASS